MKSAKSYEQKNIFLPQLIRAAETAGKAFETIRAKLAGGNEKLESKGTIVMATVRGDIHDIGKNLAKVLLENYGYDVIDLGKDVPIEEVVVVAKQHQVKLVGLSALMTTTVTAMEDHNHGPARGEFVCEGSRRRSCTDRKVRQSHRRGLLLQRCPSRCHSSRNSFRTNLNPATSQT